jgi:elongation factor Ts
VLLRQPYIRNEEITIQQLINEKVVALGENIVVRRFERYALGETTAEAE